jgi:Domain of unknown function (4846)
LELPEERDPIVRMPLFCLAVFLVLALGLAPAAAASASRYAWHTRDPAKTDALAARIAPPPGFTRRPVAAEGFAAWLRGLPLKPSGSEVLLHDGRPKARQDVHAAVVDIDVGARDLQQCADAIMRLRAEWLFASNAAALIAFHDTGSAKPIAFARWAEGERPKGSGRTLMWSRAAKPDAGYAAFRRYLDVVFARAGTHSLERSLQRVPLADLRAGDVFIKGGFPGHAVLVVDVVENPSTRERRFLLLQSFMPAQEMHILKNPASGNGQPWYALDFGEHLVTPEWSFGPDSLRRWP